MKEREPGKDFLVVYDDFKKISWKSEAQLEWLMKQNRVDFFKFRDAEEPTWVKDVKHDSKLGFGC